MAAAARDPRAEARAEADGVGRELLGAPHLRAEARFVAVVGDEVEDHLRRLRDYDLDFDVDQIHAPLRVSLRSQGYEGRPPEAIAHGGSSPMREKTL